MSVRIRVASSTVARVWSANTTVRDDRACREKWGHQWPGPQNRPCAASGFADRASARQQAATAINPVGWMPRVNEAVMIASAAG